MVQLDFAVNMVQHRGTEKPGPLTEEGFTHIKLAYGYVYGGKLSRLVIDDRVPVTWGSTISG